MIHILKPIISVLMFLTVLFFIYTILTITTNFSTGLNIALSFVCGVLAFWFTWQLLSGKKTSISVAVTGSSLILGGLCFIVGFLGPMIFAKDTSQGPMIGIFIAAPLGVILGAIAGYVYAAKQNVASND